MYKIYSFVLILIKKLLHFWIAIGYYKNELYKILNLKYWKY